MTTQPRESRDDYFRLASRGAILFQNRQTKARKLCIGITFCEAIQAGCWLERNGRLRYTARAIKPVNYSKERPVLWKSDVTTSPSTAGRFVLLSTFYVSYL
ncbi:hypothetical protein EMCRGX_G003173 [Ephydatia muelleri]